LDWPSVASWSRSIRSRALSHLHTDDSPSEVSLIDGSNSFLGVFVALVSDEAEAFGLSGVRVKHYPDLLQRPMLDEDLL
jgi:hypothetical protein